MISTYFIANRPQTNGFHLIHKDGCPFLNSGMSNLVLGNFISGDKAIAEAKKHDGKNIPCRFCMKEQHQSESSEKTNLYDLAAILPAEDQIARAIQRTFPTVLN